LDALVSSVCSSEQAHSGSTQTMNEWKPKGLELVKLAERSHRSTTSVSRVYMGRGNAFTRSAVTEAARRLGLPPPPEPQAGSSSPPSPT
jgi:hypothetical protein